jgi:16S rRNA (guanine966-N2)-methyltransferase
LRVVAGELKGRRLRAPAGGAVRPTSDRAREALFSMLGDVSGMRVLDLFAGTGALAIEALSRGAAEAVLVDTRPRYARENVEELGLADRARVVRADAIAFLRGEPDSYLLILCDPPYRLARRLEADLRKLVPAWLAPGGRIVVESAAREPIDLGLELERERRYGDALLRIWRKP